MESGTHRDLQRIVQESPRDRERVAALLRNANPVFASLDDAEVGVVAAAVLDYARMQMRVDILLGMHEDVLGPLEQSGSKQAAAAQVEVRNLRLLMHNITQQLQAVGFSPSMLIALRNYL